MPHHLLSKKGKLTPEEQREVQRAPEYAFKVLHDLQFSLPVPEAVYQMGERLDGTGQPRQLKGGEIVANARILAVANTFCALLRPRSYRMAHTVEQAMAILNETPRKYDPQVVRALQGFLQTGQGRDFLQKLRAGAGGDDGDNGGLHADLAVAAVHDAVYAAHEIIAHMRE